MASSPSLFGAVSFLPRSVSSILTALLVPFVSPYPADAARRSLQVEEVGDILTASAI